ncbi:MAG: translocation/assembly module TamB domain-containing protein [Bacteroidota bacterium]
MAKILKILAKIIGSTLEWLLILIIAVAFAIRTSPFQTYLAELATDYLSKELDTELHIGKVDIYFFDRLALDDVFVRDQHGDTLASLGSIDVTLQSLNLSANKMVLKNIALNNGRVGISRDSIKGDYNYAFIADYFNSGSKKKGSEPMDVTVRSLDIDQVDITYDDYRKTYNEFGMDYDHLDFRNVVLHTNEFESDGKTFAFDIEQLSASEKCGIVLNRLEAHCLIGYRGILLSNVKINTSRSRVYAQRFNLRMTGLSDMRSFEDSVSFDAMIDSSEVSMVDVSYFAPQLKGMYQKVYLRAGLRQKTKNLKINDIDLRTGERTILRGDILLPDFKSLDGSFLKEKISYAYIDLEDVKALRLPDNAVEKFISFDPMIERLGYFEVKNLDLIGYWSEFVMASKQLRTELGTVHLDNGLIFSALDEGGYAFDRSANSDYDVKIDSFNLAKFIDDPMYGKVRGSLFMSGVVGQKDVIRLTKLDGLINSAGFNGYTYSNIVVSEGSYINKIFEAHIEVKDPHLELTYDGSIDLNKGRESYDFTVQMPKADLGILNFTKNPKTSLIADFAINFKGTDLSNYNGTISLERLSYHEDSNAIVIPNMDLTLTRGAQTDRVEIKSGVANATVTGKVSPKFIDESINNMLSKPLSAYFQYKPFPAKNRDNSFFDLEVDVFNATDVLRIFAPDLSISSGTHLDVHYNAPKQEETIDLTSGQIMYDSIIARNLTVNQSLLAGNVKTNVTAGYFSVNDSLFVNNVNLAITGADNIYNSTIKWNEGQANPAQFVWRTTLAESGRVDVKLKPSFFSVKNQLWEIQNSSRLIYADHRLEIDHLVLERDVQFIAINGVLSDLKEDEVTLNLNDIHLDEFSSFINTKVAIEGNVSGDVRISTPFTAVKAEGKLNVEGLVIKQEPIGDVFITGLWNNENKSVAMSGDLKYLKQETFYFTGDYFPYKEHDNIDFDLVFEGMDLQFANAFIDPSLLTDIRGKIKGDITLKGDVDAPIIDGKLRLENGNVKVGLLGTSYKMSGPILFDGESGGFYIDNMPLLDEEYNKAFVTATINHTKFENWNCAIEFNIEDDYSQLNYRGVPQPIERFLLLNTQYKEGDAYYGRAYGTGTASIYITDKETEINVNVKTESGTKIDLPMYGKSELAEGKFIKVGPPGQTDEDSVKHDLDLTGLNLNMHFDVTPEAEVRLIFNPKTGDQIVSHGQAGLDISLDNLNDLKMKGVYTVVGKDNYYNFVVGPIKQPFKIKEGGTITWSGDPLDARLDLVAYNLVRADINEITPDVTNTSSSGNQEVQCVMRITQTLYDPLITLDIEAPKATESERTILASVKASPDELQRQFFSLLLLKKFAPLAGQNTVGGGGIADVLTQQINGLLEEWSQNVDIRLAYDDKEGGQDIALGFEKNLGRVVLKGSFGVANSTDAQSETQSNLIGDMSLEYLINDDGSFRVNLFNESNDNSVIQDKTQGLFTQGVGLHYQKEFNNMKDFKQKKQKTKKRRKKTAIPKPDTPPVEEKKDPPATLPEPQPDPDSKKEEE